MATNTALEETRPEAAAAAGKALTFRLGAEEYGIAILRVREIIGLMEITRVPRTPALVRGVINLRGKVIAVVDLRTRFGLPATEDTRQTCIIVVEVGSGGHSVPVGVIVDEVCEVRDVDPAQVEQPPEFGAAVDTSFLVGMAKFGSKVVMLLNVDAVFAPDEIGAIEDAARDN
jgi:purine-binding chemotaxis protein CheW